MPWQIIYALYMCLPPYLYLILLCWVFFVEGNLCWVSQISQLCWAPFCRVSNDQVNTKQRRSLPEWRSFQVLYSRVGSWPCLQTNAYMLSLCVSTASTHSAVSLQQTMIWCRWTKRRVGEKSKRQNWDQSCLKFAENWIKPRNLLSAYLN
jgi:hypothetical protein